MWDDEIRKKHKHLFETNMEVDFCFCFQTLLAHQSIAKSSLESIVCRIHKKLLRQWVVFLHLTSLSFHFSK